VTRRHGRTGQTLVEFAFVLPIFLLILCGTIDAGRWVYTQNSLNNATTDAARGLAVKSHPSDCLPADDWSTCAQKIVNGRVVAIGGVPVATTTCWRLVAGTRTQVSPLTNCAEGDYVQVFAVVNPWQVLTPFLSSFLSPHIDASAQSEVKST
jgi:Flp pilus assembly protein TadG